MRLASIASGSTGNCIYVGTGRYHILIDAGISLKRIEAGLAELGLASAADIDAVLITHEHSDHVSGLGTLLKRYRTPLYASPGTIAELEKMAALQPYAQDCFHYVTAGNRFVLGDMTILPIHTPHDAAEPCMFRVESGTAAAAVVTDVGTVTDGLTAALQDLDALFLEANHDVRMLQVGPYPYFLKQRILSDSGHLSNEAAANMVLRILQEEQASGRPQKNRLVLLAHLSKENNFPEMALQTMSNILGMGGFSAGGRLRITVLSRTERSPLYTL
ncbi:MAG: MBL fold metallo-hydrolase [Firmicutes bacterium]|nr:MBL fold metallo-hydrolase [Bacillota bacterium]